MIVTIHDDGRTLGVILHEVGGSVKLDAGAILTAPQLTQLGNFLALIRAQALQRIRAELTERSNTLTGLGG